MIGDMSRSEAGLIIFASLLMAAIVISYVCQNEAPGSAAIFKQSAANEVQFLPVVDVGEDEYEKWRAPSLPHHLESAEQDDLVLIKYIRENWILPPPTHSLRRLSHPETYDHSEYGQSFVVDKLLHGKENGFFVDVWPGNGETDSNTLFFEKDRHWKGLFIEPNPNHFRSLVGKRRHGYLLNACVSPTRKPSVLNLTYGETFDMREVLVQCFPLYSILKALDVSHVDFLSMKSQLELDILKTLPHDDPNFTIDALTIETHINKNRRETAAVTEEIKKLMTSHGYIWVNSGEKINKKNVILHRIAAKIGF